MNRNNTSSVLRLGISPLSWVNEVLDDLGKGTSAETCLSEAAAAGYAGVELSKIFPKDHPATLKRLLEGHGLALATGWYNGFLAGRSVEEELQAVVNHAELLAGCGCDVLVYGECARMADNALDIGMSARLQLAADEWGAYGERLTRFAEAVQQRFGLALSYHHHLMMVVQTLDEVRALMANTGPAVGLLLDTGHAWAAGYDYSILIDEFGGRINHIQLKDVRADIMADVHSRDLSFNQGVRNGMFTIPGDGVLDFSALSRFVNDGRYRGHWLVVEAEQDPQKAPPLETVTRAWRFVTRQMEALSRPRKPYPGHSQNNAVSPGLS